MLGGYTMNIVDETGMLAGLLLTAPTPQLWTCDARLKTERIVGFALRSNLAE